MAVDIRVVGEVILADGEVVALLNTEPGDPVIQREFQEKIEAIDEGFDVPKLLLELEDDLLTHKQAGWIRVSVLKQVLCDWSAKYDK